MALEREVLSTLSATERRQLGDLLRRLALVVEARGVRSEE
jgi:hypothetical protein